MAAPWLLRWIMHACLLVLAKSSAYMQCHLKPFGCHKPPSVEVTEFTIESAPVPEEFFMRYVNLEKPVIFRSGITHSAASQKWTDNYISKHYGDMEVRLEAKNEQTHLPPKGEKFLGRDTLRHFVETYHGDDNNVYIVSDLPQAMYKEVGIIPSFGACGPMAKSIVEVDLWWSGGGTSSVIHKDEHNQINCLINGTKQWKLIELKYEKFLYKHNEPDYELGGFSDVDPNAVDLNKYPDVANIEWSNFTINAGDCLFLPKGYYHLVKSSGTQNLAVSILFSRFDNRDAIDFSDCSDPVDMKMLPPLVDFDVQWPWTGNGIMVMGRQDLEQRYRTVFAQSIENYGGKVNRASLLRIIKEKFTPEDMILRSGDVSNVFDMIDKNYDGIVTCEEINNLTWTDLRAVASEIEPFEPSAVYWFEYSVIPFERVWNLLKVLLERFDVVTKTTWLTKYQELGGTEDFGYEIYTRLLDNNDEIRSDGITDDDIWYALENWVKFWALQYSGLKRKPSRSDAESVWKLAAQQEDSDDWKDRSERIRVEL